MERYNQLWSTEINYFCITRRFVYLMAIIDWYIRYVPNWALSTKLEAQFCIDALNETLESSSCEIFNTNQGSQFTSHRFTEPLSAKGDPCEYGW